MTNSNATRRIPKGSPRDNSPDNNEASSRGNSPVRGQVNDSPRNSSRVKRNQVKWASNRSKVSLNQVRIARGNRVKPVNDKLNSRDSSEGANRVNAARKSNVLKMADNNPVRFPRVNPVKSPANNRNRENSQVNNLASSPVEVNGARGNRAQRSVAKGSQDNPEWVRVNSRARILKVSPANSLSLENNQDSNPVRPRDNPVAGNSAASVVPGARSWAVVYLVPTTTRRPVSI